jgi:hypothetical protein
LKVRKLEFYVIDLDILDFEKNQKYQKKKEKSRYQTVQVLQGYYRAKRQKIQ